jgi:hypothetical protein
VRSREDESATLTDRSPPDRPAVSYSTTSTLAWAASSAPELVELAVLDQFISDA